MAASSQAILVTGKQSKEQTPLMVGTWLLYPENSLHLDPPALELGSSSLRTASISGPTDPLGVATALGCTKGSWLFWCDGKSTHNTPDSPRLLGSYSSSITGSFSEPQFPQQESGGDNTSSLSRCKQDGWFSVGQTVKARQLLVYFLLTSLLRVLSCLFSAFLG